MGLYYVACKSCKTNFVWFSGDGDRVCDNCFYSKKEEEIMKNDLETQLIESLKATIKAKDDLIESLKKEVSRLTPPVNTLTTAHNPYYDQTDLVLGSNQPHNPFILTPNTPYTITGVTGTLPIANGGDSKEVIENTVQNNYPSVQTTFHNNGTGLAYTYSNPKDNL